MHESVHGSPGCGCVAADGGSLAETVVAVMVLSIAATMLVTVAFTSTRSQKSTRLKVDAVNLIEQYIAGARRIDCVQSSGIQISGSGVFEEVCGPAPPTDSSLTVELPTDQEMEEYLQTSGTLRTDKNSEGATSPHDLISLEWRDYYHVESCKSGTSVITTQVPRAVREITAKWRDRGDREITRKIIGPVVPHSRGWRVHYESAVSKWNNRRDKASQKIFTSGNPDVWATSYEGCSVVVGRLGEITGLVTSSGSSAVTCTLRQGGDQNAGDPPASTCAWKGGT